MHCDGAVSGVHYAPRHCKWPLAVQLRLSDRFTGKPDDTGSSVG